MMTEEEALSAIFAAVPPAETETLPLAEAAGRMASVSVTARLPLPLFDNSAMDGWAVHDSDCGTAGVPLRIAGEQPAGAARPLRVQPGEAVRIFTGAPLPPGTAAVVMQEDTVRTAGTVTILDAAKPGDFIRRAGSDVCPGQLLVRKGMPLTPQRIGVLASQGISAVDCGRRPRAGIVCTGEELIAPGLPLPREGCLYNSNGPLLAALLAASGTAIPGSQDTVRDDPVLLAACLSSRLEENDVLVIAGGVSVGDHDFVKPALQALGIEPAFWRVSIRPGKPFLFAVSGRKLIFGLPGNPVSAYVTALLFVLPALRRMAGAAEAAAVLIPARTRADLSNRGDRRHYLRGRFDAAEAAFVPAGVQESHAIAGLSQANALVRLEPGESVSAGGSVQVLLLP